ncbi:SDR family NAD(P)-dependent oxidoreductase [Halobacillus sp. GSS1]|uniref:SDR family NAD(P)-dependent oxidoreductase n=1 Tax=Halobacillus sp. GSS1 TaxID=2815919 RepID=UPI001A90C3C8|nr:SDR family NAD(P)-dependent oxidoreductase [Halobacillus sp. GSS1]MBN9653405.1 SDR family NAD(P)-dependent oxidoreductase [Halobacillus sp. GSS1]
MKILITGATDGIGLATARMLVDQGHEVLLHGRNDKKLSDVVAELGEENTEQYVADLSQMEEVDKFAQAVAAEHDRLDVLINNAGVYSAPSTVTEDGLDIRFAVNTVAPYMLTKALLPLMDESSRVVNLSSAAQQPVDAEALSGGKQLGDGEAYAQSKLALTMWTYELSHHVAPVVVAVNPMSLLGSKMVKNAFGLDGKDINIGAEILCRAALSDTFQDASGKYFDNDIGEFGDPHPDAQDREKCEALIQKLDAIIQ